MNAESHYSTNGITFCRTCPGPIRADAMCTPDHRCRCCLTAEVAALRAQVTVLEVCAESEATRGNEYEAQVADADAKIQSLREVRFVPIVTGDRRVDQMTMIQAAKDEASVRRILDGGDA